MKFTSLFFRKNLFPLLTVLLLLFSVSIARSAETIRLSVNGDGIEGDSESWDPCYTQEPEHNYYAFTSYGDNFFPINQPGISNPNSDIYILKRDSHEFLRVLGWSENWVLPNGKSEAPEIGINDYEELLIVFQSQASNLSSSVVDSNNVMDIYYCYIDFYSVPPYTSCGLVSVNNSGTAAGNGESKYPAFSSNATYVAFQSSATDIAGIAPAPVSPMSSPVPQPLAVNDTNGWDDVFFHTKTSYTTVLVSVGVTDTPYGQVLNQGDDDSGSPDISDDGRFIAYHSYASNLVPGDTNGIYDIFVTELDDPDSYDPRPIATTRVSVSSTGTESDGNSYYPTISSDGRYIAFQSEAGNLVDNDTNDTSDIFVHDRETQTTIRVNIDNDGQEAVGTSWYATISGDGQTVAYYSSAANLVIGDNNLQDDIFMYHRPSGTVKRVSVASDGTEANGVSGNPFIADDGTWIAFSSDATDLVNSDTNSSFDTFLHGSIDWPAAVSGTKVPLAAIMLLLLNK